MTRRLVLNVLLITLIPWVAYAHVDHTGDGFGAGLRHPVLGLDHLLAMISVGILSAQMGGRAIWTVPLTFVLVMVIGGILGVASIKLFAVEIGIAISVVALGTAIAASKKLPILLTMYLIGLFAIFHGHAHGTEMPNNAKPLLYSLGFVCGTTGIHIAGVVIGLLSTRTPRGSALLRFTGLAIAGIGLYMLFAR